MKESHRLFTQINFLFSSRDVNPANEATFKFVLGNLTHETQYLINVQGLDLPLPSKASVLTTPSYYDNNPGNHE